MMRKKIYKIILWVIGLILTFVIDFVIAYTTNFIGHAGYLEIFYIIFGIYLLEVRKDVV